MRFSSYALVLLLLMVPADPAAAQSPSPKLDRSRWYVGVGLGAFDPKDTPGQFENKEGDISWMLDLGYRYSKYVRFECDLWGSEQDVDTPATVPPPAFGTVDSRSDLSSGAISAGMKVGLPLGGFEPYAGAGAGLYFTTWTITGSILGLPASREENDVNVGQHLLAGLDVWVRETWALGVEYRRIFLKGNFGSAPGGELDIGGTSLMATLRWSGARPQ